MSLKYKYLKKDEVPGEHASLYIEKDGVFVLDVEGVSDKAKLEEFRQNNIKLQDALLAILAGFFDNTNGVLRTTRQLNIYSDVVAGSITDAMRLLGDTFLTGLNKLGEASPKITAVAMHSDVEALLRTGDLIDDLPDSTGKVQIKVFQGRRVIVDDNCPKVSGTNSPGIPHFFCHLN